MSTTATLNRMDGTTTQSRTNKSKTGDLRPFETSSRDPVSIQSRRRDLSARPPEVQNAKSSKPALSLKTSPTDTPRSPRYETTTEWQPHSAYTYNTFPSISPKLNRDIERRNSTWAVPRRAYVPSNISPDDNLRCNILYVSNLPTETSEAELEGIFSSQAGYKRMSLRTTANGPSCFVEFDDVTRAAKALRNLYGWPLKNSTMGGIRLSFSKDHLGIPPPRALTPRTPRRAPPPSPLALPVRTPLHSPTGFASTVPRRPVVEPESSNSSSEVQSASSASVGESTTTVSEDKLSEGEASPETETAQSTNPGAAKDGAPGSLDMYTVRGPDYEVGTFDQYRLWLERAVEMELDWYPLPPIKQSLRSSQPRLLWTYNGHHMSIYLNEDETQRCSGYLDGTRAKPLNSKPAVALENSAITYARRAKATVEAWARILALSWRLSQSDNSRPDNASDANDTPPRLESHLCLEKYPTPTQESTLLRLRSVERMQDDFEFFVQARRMLCEAEGSWIRQLLPWSYHEVKFSRVCSCLHAIKAGLKDTKTKQFHFPSDGSKKVRTTDETSPSDPQDILGGYEVKCRQGPDMETHLRVCSHILLEGIRYPEIGRGSRIFLDGVPMLRRPIAFEKETMLYDRGFSVRQSLSIPKILAWTTTTAIIGLMLMPFFVLLSLFVSVFILFLLRLVGRTQLRL